MFKKSEKAFKAIAFVFAVILSVSLVFTGCKKDDDKGKTSTAGSSTKTSSKTTSKASGSLGKTSAKPSTSAPKSGDGNIDVGGGDDEDDEPSNGVDSGDIPSITMISRVKP